MTIGSSGVSEAAVVSDEADEPEAAESDGDAEAADDAEPDEPDDPDVCAKTCNIKQRNKITDRKNDFFFTSMPLLEKLGKHDDRICIRRHYKRNYATACAHALPTFYAQTVVVAPSLSEPWV